MTESHPPPEPGWSRSLWPRRWTTERLWLEARLCRWRFLVFALFGSVALAACDVFMIYDALRGEPHRWSRYRNPIFELSFGPIGLIFFCAGSAYIVWLMVLKYRLASSTSASPSYESLDRLLPMHKPKVSADATSTRHEDASGSP
jgi:hypothetical protein